MVLLDVVTLPLIVGTAMEWLNNFSAAITAIASVLLTFITGYYAYLTLGLLKENKELRTGMNRPELAIYASVHEGYVQFLNLVVENVGPGAAYNVQLATEREFKPGSEIDVRKLGLFRHTLGFFASRHKIEHFLASMVDSWDELMSEPLSITATYSDSSGKVYEKRFAINFAVFENLTRMGKQPLYSLADDLEEIRKIFHNLATGFNKMQVLTEPLEQYRSRTRAEHLYYLIRQLPENEQREFIENLQARRRSRSPRSQPSSQNPEPATDS